MLGQTSASERGMNVLSGFSRRKRWRSPVSVPMRIVFAALDRAHAHIPPVESAASAASTTSRAHSGWTRTGAPRCAARAASIVALESRACVGQYPGQRM